MQVLKEKCFQQKKKLSNISVVFLINCCNLRRMFPVKWSVTFGIFLDALKIYCKPASHWNSVSSLICFGVSCTRDTSRNLEDESFNAAGTSGHKKLENSQFHRHILASVSPQLKLQGVKGFNSIAGALELNINNWKKNLSIDGLRGK